MIMKSKSVFLIILAIACRLVSAASFAQRPDTVRKLISYIEGRKLYGNPDNANEAPFIFHSSLNYAFHKNLSAGIGVGVEFLKESYLPVTANVLYQFGDKKIITPFVRLQAGYPAPLESNTLIPGEYYSIENRLDSRGGFMANPSVGIIVYTRIGQEQEFTAIADTLKTIFLTFILI
jgi:hypothetical protein